ncbi:DUF1788 domain-containing protein [Acidovorax temperans]|jgi:hypothetical protein|nr:DUF1788 domain-containing protein [Aquabacterium sp.]HRL98854.1 DUF1788 domain-containing protein [Acidovorax sp.]
MTTRFEERLNQILPRLVSPDVLSNQGAGGEIGFWIFDYPPEEEMAMRAWLADVIEPGLRKQVPAVRFQTVDLFQLVVDLLDERKLFDKACEMQANKGDAAVLASLRSVLKEDRLAARMTEKLDVTQLDLLIVKGVGAVYPLLRTHTLLSALHPHMRNTPLLMLYPGTYNGQSLSLFNTLSDDNYYRAFRLVS